MDVRFFALSLLTLATAGAQDRKALLGKQLASEFRERMTVIESPVVQRYLDRVGERIAPSGTFTLIAEDPCPEIHEPIGFPGDSFFVPAALFLAAESEDELAGMLAHAWAHVQAVPAEPLILVGCGPIHRREAEANAVAEQTMERAGFDPKALGRYLERVKSQRSAGEFVDVREEVRRLTEPPKREPPSLLHPKR